MNTEEEHLSEQGRSSQNSISEDANLLPDDLSGDENAQKGNFGQSDDSKASFLLSVALIMKTVIGVGIISLPYTLSRFGYIFGILIFILVGILSQMSSLLLIKAKNLSRRSNYPTILYHIYPTSMSKAFGNMTIILANVGMCIAELTILKASIRQLLIDVIGGSVSNQFYTQKWFIILVLAICELPLTLVTKIQRLRYFAFAGVSGISTFILFLFVHYVIERSNGRGGDFAALSAFPKDWYEVATVIPNLLLALTFHNNFFPIFKGMRQSNDNKMKLAALTATILCAVFYLTAGIIGYLLSGDKAQPNYLLSIKYDQANHIVFFAINLGFLVCVIFSFPVMYFGARNNFIAIIQLYLSRKHKTHSEKKSQVSEYSSRCNEKKQRILFILSTIGLYGVIIVVSILVDNIQLVFNIIGSICASSMGILLPCFFYFSLIEKKKMIRTAKYFYAKILFFVFIPYCLFSIVSGYL